MKLPVVKFKDKNFIWDSRLKEFRPEQFDINWCSLRVDNSVAEVMDSAVYNNDLKLQRLCLLDALDMNDARGMIQ